MGLDIRVPLGLIFLIIGGIMSVYGLLTRGSDLYAKSMDVTLNLIWGILMVVFGATYDRFRAFSEVRAAFAGVNPAVSASSRPWPSRWGGTRSARGWKASSPRSRRWRSSRTP